MFWEGEGLVGSKIKLQGLEKPKTETSKECMLRSNIVIKCKYFLERAQTVKEEIFRIYETKLRWSTINKKLEF